jgi:hypothetical protein
MVLAAVFMSISSPLSSCDRLGCNMHPEVPNHFRQVRFQGYSQVPILAVLRLRGGKKFKMGKKVRQLHNYVPKQQRVGENPMQINKPHRKRKKHKDREKAQRKLRNVQDSVKVRSRYVISNFPFKGGSLLGM